MNKLIKLIIPFLLVSSLVGCQNKPADESKADESSEVESSETSDSDGREGFIDYVHTNETARLSLDYKGHDFYTDGIGEVTLRTAIDCDTAHFNPVVTTTSTLAIKARFYGIDTPESTGRIQPYGKGASNFTKSKLKSAAENGTIVISTAREDYGAPEYDSTGSRFVSLVWINETEKHAPFDSLVLLNLWIVQEGFSWVKNVDAIPRFKEVFLLAEAQARKYKLNLFSGEDDPDFPKGDFEIITLLDLKQETERIISDPNYESIYDNKKISVTGTIAGFTNGILYLQDYFSEENGGRNGGEYAAINCFCGMSAVPEKYTALNTYVRVCGVALNSENFGFQISGLEGHFPTVPSLREDDDVEILLKASENVDEHQLTYLEYTKAELNTVTTNKTFDCLNCAVRVTENLTVRDVYINDDQTEITLYFTDCSFNAYITFPYAGNPDKPQHIWKTADDFLGKSFSLQGVYTYHKTQSGKYTYQIVFNNAGDLVCVE